jgi:hypothetical protein
MKENPGRRPFSYWFIFCVQKSVFIAMNGTDRFGYYQLSVHPNQMNLSYVPDSRRRYRPPEGYTPDQFKDNRHKGVVSQVAGKKITRAIDYLVYLAQPKRLPYTQAGKGLKFYLSFITVTLSSDQIHSDADIMLHCFSPLLNSLRQKWGCHNYLWRAERQANGRIHYHIIADKFIPWNELRNVWNRHQEALGYVSRYRSERKLWHRDGFRFRSDLAGTWPRAEQIKAYKEGTRTDWHSPNSSDIHSLRFVGNVRAYFKKYLTKDGQNSNIAGRLWGCSSNLSNIPGARIMVWSRIEDEFKRIKADRRHSVYQSDYFTCIFFTVQDLERLKCFTILETWYAFIQDTFPDARPRDLFSFC